MKYEYEHAFSCEKPSSETHTWSYKMACDGCLEQIEKKHGVDWKVTEIVYQDLGRETKTHTDTWGRRTWRCTHKVKAFYSIEHRLIDTRSDKKFTEESINITYQELNLNFQPGVITSD